MAVQDRYMEEPTVPIGLGGERNTDVIKPLGTEEKGSKDMSIYMFIEIGSK